MGCTAQGGICLARAGSVDGFHQTQMGRYPRWREWLVGERCSDLKACGVCCCFGSLRHRCRQPVGQVCGCQVCLCSLLCPIHSVLQARVLNLGEVSSLPTVILPSSGRTSSQSHIGVDFESVLFLSVCKPGSQEYRVCLCQEETGKESWGVRPSCGPAAAWS